MTRKHPKSTHVPFEPASHRRHKTHKRNLTWLWVGLGALLVAVVGILLLASQVNPSVEITPAQAYAKYQQGVFFQDVRTQEEWNQFHLAKSTLIPLDQLPNRLNELPKNQNIVVVCLSGHRSQSGVTILQQAGFKRVSYLSGGLQAWIAAGYPVQGNAP
jgi:rhodanese-related sulfurtransferase